MSVILRSPQMATEKRVLGAQRKISARTSVTEYVNADEQAIAEATLLEGSDRADSDALELQAERPVNDAKQVAEELGKRAFEEGFEKGMRAGEAEGREAYTSGLQQLEDLTQSLDSSIQRSLAESEDMMVAIVYETVCKMVGDALATKEGVVAVVKEAMSKVRGKSSIIIRVNPFDLELIEESAAFGVASEADWRADESIPMGGCVIESEYGTLDARIETQLNQLKRVLLATRHKPVEPVDDKRAE